MFLAWHGDDDGVLNFFELFGKLVMLCYGFCAQTTKEEQPGQLQCPLTGILTLR